jgi:F-type H+-transporting ATPase subunit delta
MIETKISSRYARALLDAAREKNNQDKVLDDSQHLLDLLKKERTLLNILRSPVVPKEIKHRIVSRLFTERYDKLTCDFLSLIIKKGREQFLVDIFTLYNRFYNVEHKISTATITTADEVDERLLEQAKKLVSDFTHTKVILTPQVNKDIVGGFILEFSDKKLDASVASYLKRLQINLAN